MTDIPSFCPKCGSRVVYVIAAFRFDPSTGEPIAYREIWTCEHPGVGEWGHYRKSIVHTNQSSSLGVFWDNFIHR